MSAASIAVIAPKADKDFQTLQAQFALKGHSVVRGDREDFIVTKWGLVRFCKDIAELRDFARHVGVRE